MRIQRGTHSVAAATVVALVLAGCASRSAIPPAPPVPQEQTISQLVGVVLREFEFEPRPFKAKAGLVRFQLMNRGSVEHDFMIPTVMEPMEHEKDLVQPGKTKIIEVELRPGAYEVVCTVSGHKDAGMTAKLEVTP